MARRAEPGTGVRPLAVADGLLLVLALVATTLVGDGATTSAERQPPGRAAPAGRTGPGGGADASIRPSPDGVYRMRSTATSDPAPAGAAPPRAHESATRVTTTSRDGGVVRQRRDPVPASTSTTGGGTPGHHEVTWRSDAVTVRAVVGSPPPGSPAFDASCDPRGAVELRLPVAVGRSWTTERTCTFLSGHFHGRSHERSRTTVTASRTETVAGAPRTVWELQVEATVEGTFSQPGGEPTAMRATSTSERLVAADLGWVVRDVTTSRSERDGRTQTSTSRRELLSFTPA